MSSERPPPKSSPPPRPPSPRASSRPPSGRAKRPWYLVAALVLSLLLGAGGWISGCGMINLFRDPDQATLAPDSQLSAEDHDKLQQAFDQRLNVLFAAKNRLFALNVGEFVLGAAILALTIRALGGQGTARTLLVQVVLVQAALVILNYLLTADVRDADAAFAIASARLEPPKGATPADVALVTSPIVVKAIVGIWTAARIAAGALISVALTRPGTRRFYEAISESLSER